MYAIISELDHATSHAIDMLRSEAFTNCPINKPKMKWPYHISWQGAQDYALSETEGRVRMISRTFGPLETWINGIGLFPGAAPVLYLSVSRNPELSALNATLWEALQPLATQINPYFSPEEWIPHISIFYGDDQSASALGCAIEKILIKPIRLRLEIGHLSLGSFQGQENKTLFRYPLTGNG